MAEILGPATILALALPTGVDGTKVAQWQLRDGITWQQFVSEYSLALGGFNEEMVSMWGWLFGLVDEPFLEYEDGGAVTEAKDITDVDKVDSISGSTLGHMLDLRVYGTGVGGTKRYFRDKRSSQVAAHLRASVRQLRWRFEKKLLTRMFTNTENAIGSAGYDVPFVRGTGGNVDFTPPAFSGEVFTSSHDHFIGVDSDTKGFDDVIEELVEHLVEHGHMAPFDVIVAKADIDAGSYHALADFVELKAAVIQMIDRGGATSGNQFFSEGQADLRGIAGYYQSRYGQVNIRANSRVPTNYAAIGKSYGRLDPRNPLGVRVHPDVGFGARIVTETTNDDQYPIKQVNAEMEFGVSVGEDRTNGAAAFLDASGAWTNPTIS